MKIDELISEPEQVKEEHGNLKIWSGEIGLVYKDKEDNKHRTILC